MKKSSRNWSPQEDKMLEMTMMGSSGDRKLKWQQIAQLMQKKIGCQKTGKQCRQRWHNHLAPQLNNSSQWTQQENNTLFQKHSQLGNKWAKIATFLKGRTDNCVKNHFYSTLRRGMRKVNNFIHDQRKQKNSIKQFKPDVLTKILIVADGDPEQKLNAKNNASELSKNIKQLLISVSLDTDQNTYDEIKIDKVISYIMEFNKNCKKRKGKKKAGSSEKNVVDDKDQEQMEEEQEQQQEVKSQEFSQIGNKVQAQSYIKQKNITLAVPNNKPQSFSKYQHSPTSSPLHSHNKQQQKSQQINLLAQNSVITVSSASTSVPMSMPSNNSNINTNTNTNTNNKQIKQETQVQFQVKPRLKRTFVNEEVVENFQFPFNNNGGNKFKNIIMPVQPLMNMNIDENKNTNSNGNGNNKNNKNNKKNKNQQTEQIQSPKLNNNNNNYNINLKSDQNPASYLYQNPNLNNSNFNNFNNFNNSNFNAFNNNNNDRKTRVNKAYSAQLDQQYLNNMSASFANNNKNTEPQPIPIFTQSGIFNLPLNNINDHNNIVSRQLLADSAAQVYQSNVILNNLSAFSQKNSILNFQGDKGTIDLQLFQSGQLRRSAIGFLNGSNNGVALSNSVKLDQFQAQTQAQAEKK